MAAADVEKDAPRDVVMAATIAAIVVSAMIAVSAPMARASALTVKPTQLNLSALKLTHKPWSIAQKLAATSSARNAPGATLAVSVVRHADHEPRLRPVQVT
jgi:hypothetical protein